MAKRMKNTKIDEALLKKIIRDYCFKRLESCKIPEDLADDTDMFKKGIIDSIDALELLIGFEEDFGIIIPEELKDVSGLASIAGISRFVIENIDLGLLEERLGMKLTLN
jgi:acyl carrier protein